jgi:hypothetical protein
MRVACCAEPLTETPTRGNCRKHRASVTPVRDTYSFLNRVDKCNKKNGALHMQSKNDTLRTILSQVSYKAHGTP